MMVENSTPMGPPAPDSRLWRLGEGQRVIAELRYRAWTLMRIARELGRTDSAVGDYARLNTVRDAAPRPGYRCTMLTIRTLCG
jgi:hypothetical protein